MIAIISSAGIGPLHHTPASLFIPLEFDLVSPGLEKRGGCVERTADPWQGAGLTTPFLVSDDCANLWESQGGYLDLVNVSF